MTNALHTASIHEPTTTETAQNTQNGWTTCSFQREVDRGFSVGSSMCKVVAQPGLLVTETSRKSTAFGQEFSELVIEENKLASRAFAKANPAGRVVLELGHHADNQPRKLVTRSPSLSGCDYGTRSMLGFHPTALRR